MKQEQNHFDVIIVGAGLSGIGTARQLQDKCPQKTFVMLEGRDSVGGTWDLFRYPGIRSDSDMFTMSYANKPWIDDTNLVSDGSLILSYLKEAAEERGLFSKIRFKHQVKSAHWSTETSCWTITAETTSGMVSLTGNILMICSGYYNYEQGHTPQFPGFENFKGKIIHPQHWPENFDYSGKKVIVIGSGATAVTVVPAMSKTASHVTMLQRSPTYILPWPTEDKVAKLLKMFLPKQTAHNWIRWKNIYLQKTFFVLAKKYPDFFRKMILFFVKRELPKDFDAEKHFSPRYNPWDQRLCVVPDGDLFKTIKSGKTSVETDEIEKFIEDGLLLKSGKTLKADIIVTATGLEMRALGKLNLSVDHQQITLAESYTYKGVMLSNVPNLVYTFGYINASWTLRSEMVAHFACNLINEMDKRKATFVVPTMNAPQNSLPMIKGFSSGYLQRGLSQFPRQGETAPWTMPQDYLQERQILLKKNLFEDGVLQFGSVLLGYEGVTQKQSKAVDQISTQLVSEKGNGGSVTLNKPLPSERIH